MGCQHPSEPKIQPWSPGGETVSRLLTDWHGLQLLDDGFYGHLVGEGCIDEYSNCENGTYDCDSCPLDGGCDRQQYMEAAKDADTFDDFCSQFLSCKGCPLVELKGDCEDEF